MKTGRKVIAILFFILWSISSGYAQRMAIKTNTLGWLTASPNIEGEFVLSNHFTLGMSVAANPVRTDKLKTTFTHFQPEVRYWINRPMVSHFIGLTAFANNFNMRFDEVNHKGDAFAAGLTYGYAWILSPHWNIEATLGVGVLHYRQFKYDEGTAKPTSVNDRRTMLAPIKLGVSFAYILR